MSKPTIDTTRILWITEKDVAATVSLNEAMDALSDGLASEAIGDAKNIDKTLGTWDGQSSMHALGAMMPIRGYVGFKTWANTPRGAAAVFSLFSAGDGQLVAMMEAGALGQMRTSGISGLATRALADPAADDMALVGTGAQALMQVAAIAVTRRLRRLRIFSPSPEKRVAFLSVARANFSFESVDCETLEEATRDASIITLITRAKSPFLHGFMIARGAHINAAGAVLPGNAEFHQDVFTRTSMLVVDSLPNTRKGSTEFRERFGTGEDGWQTVTTLGDVLAQKVRRSAATDITLFKPMGMGLSDLAVAVLVFERAHAVGTGTPLERGTRASPRWSVDRKQTESA